MCYFIELIHESFDEKLHRNTGVSHNTRSNEFCLSQPPFFPQLQCYVRLTAPGYIKPSLIQTLYILIYQVSRIFFFPRHGVNYRGFSTLISKRLRAELRISWNLGHQATKMLKIRH